MKNEYGQIAEKCINYGEKCKLKFYNNTCVICKGQFCQRYDSRKIINIDELAEKIGINRTTLYSFLGSFRFDKFKIKGMKPESYELNQDFLNRLLEFLSYKAQRKEQFYKNIKKLENFKLTIEDDNH